MSDKPEALRLADALSAAIKQVDADDDVIHVPRWFVADAVDELRRLHADAERYLWVLRHYGEFHGDWTLAAFQRRAQEKGIGPGLDGAIDAAIAAEFLDAAIDAAMGKT